MKAGITSIVGLTAIAASTGAGAAGAADVAAGATGMLVAAAGSTGTGVVAAAAGAIGATGITVSAYGASTVVVQPHSSWLYVTVVLDMDALAGISAAGHEDVWWQAQPSS